MSDWSVRSWTSLGHLAMAEGPNEIAAIPEPLERLDVRGSFATVEAAGRLSEIAVQIVAGEAADSPALKRKSGDAASGGAGTVFEHLEKDFADAPVRRHVERTQAHGRTTSWRQQSRAGLCPADHGMSDNSRNDLGGVSARFACLRAVEDTKGAKR